MLNPFLSYPTIKVWGGEEAGDMTTLKIQTKLMPIVFALFVILIPLFVLNPFLIHPTFKVWSWNVH